MRAQRLVAQQSDRISLDDLRSKWSVQFRNIPTPGSLHTKTPVEATLVREWRNKLNIVSV